MSDIEKARLAIAGHSIAVCRDGELFTDDGRGVAPMLKFLADGRDMRGASVCDIIVGRAAALLFAYAGIVCVHAQVLSKSGESVLRAHNITYTFDTLTDAIVNRRGDGPCPMEVTTAGIDDPAAAYVAVRDAYGAMQRPHG